MEKGSEKCWNVLCTDIVYLSLEQSIFYFLSLSYEMSSWYRESWERGHQDDKLSADSFIRGHRNSRDVTQSWPLIGHYTAILASHWSLRLWPQIVQFLVLFPNCSFMCRDLSRCCLVNSGHKNHVHSSRGLLFHCGPHPALGLINVSFFALFLLPLN